MTNDFFYSGHIGLTIITAIEFYHRGMYWCVGLSMFLMMFTIVLFVISGVHYSNDLLFGIIVTIFAG